MTKVKQRKYFFDKDNDGHRYLVDVDFRKEWEEWLEIPSDDERSWNVPHFAMETDIFPRDIEFTLNQIHKPCR